MTAPRSVPRIAIVLGAAVRPDGSASPTLALRVDHAVDLLLAGQVDRLCLTGGQGRHGRAEAVVARDLALARGVPDAALLIEDLSASTFENLTGALALVPPGATLTLVSNRWHLPRAWLILRLLGHRARLSGPRARTPAHKTMAAILREIAATPVSVGRALTRGYRNGR
ncbi:YdcF family protein [Jannaschia pohangensis]|uniref:DUF218 domain-containing protein n=1 Tax=Jannaschia pohangensis TaxID=390807 RepID=A0A1I3QUW0_9RHOB|nr:YdcF family protein [Jannaschia pohangensis]SFJ38043.1 DUF218 domain-containing protein [Jannaschia pohangensis]